MSNIKRNTFVNPQHSPLVYSLRLYKTLFSKDGITLNGRVSGAGYAFS